MTNPSQDPGTERATAQALQLLLERAAICDVLQSWGLWRDRCEWEALRSLYAPGATMQTTWLDGSATDFVDISQRMSAGAARAQHYIGVPIVEVHGACAVAQTRITILVRGVLDGVAVDATCHGWFVDRLVKSEGRWLIKSRVPFYEKDTLAAVDPGVTLKLDAALLETFPAAYKHMAYVQSAVGAPVNLTLPLPGSAAQDRVLRECGTWLAAGRP